MKRSKILILFGVVFDEKKLKQIISDCQNFSNSLVSYDNFEKIKENGRKQKTAEDKLELLNNIQSKINDCNSIIELLEQSDDEILAKELEENLQNLSKSLQEIKLQALLNGKYDSKNAILTLHSGAGGTEAQDWNQMLFRMYSMYAEKKGYKITVLDLLSGDEAGIKSITFLVDGVNVYGFLKAEKGVHRLVRISPFDSNARRHTSFASVEVMPELDELSEIQIKPEDLRIDTYHSSGAGGQHVNKTDSAVRITHLKSGIVVTCQNERSQTKNKETAMKMLFGKLAERQEREEIEKMDKIRGNIKKIEWGSQIRSYVFQPYTLVKDHRTGHETSDINSVMNGEIEDFINSFLVASSR
ncbi:MAG: peptide chain release factor 2 [Clostridia bacterium]|nr:peptide chain release factor 2 [Clostridia bacterium]